MLPRENEENLWKCLHFDKQDYLNCRHNDITSIDNYFPKKFIYGWLIFRLRQSDRPLFRQYL